MRCVLVMLQMVPVCMVQATKRMKEMLMESYFAVLNGLYINQNIDFIILVY